MTSKRVLLWTAIFLAAVAAGAVAALGQATVPGENGQIVYRHLRSLTVVNPDGTGERTLTQPPRGLVDDQPDWSPDGSRVAFQRCSDDCQVWTVAASGTGLRRLGPAEDDRAEPAWRPEVSRSPTPGAGDAVGRTSSSARRSMS